MDSNHKPFDNFEIIQTSRSSTNLIFYNNAFSKIKFITKIMESHDLPILYLDFDLLFSGFFEAEYITRLPNIQVITPESETLKVLLPNILTKISSEKTIVILDSLNGLYSFLDGDNLGRFVNSLIMLFAANLKFSQSILFVTCMAQKKENVWVLPTGRHILESENINRFEIKETDSKIKVNVA